MHGAARFALCPETRPPRRGETAWTRNGEWMRFGRRHGCPFHARAPPFRRHASSSLRLNVHVHPGPSCANGIFRALVSLWSSPREIPRYSAASFERIQLSDPAAG